jgi:hypothetical protein
MSLAELEKLIGGRTILELNFKNATAEEVTEHLSKSSGLRFVSPQVSTTSMSRLATSTAATGTMTTSGSTEVPRYNAEVPKMEFWSAVRLWSTSETERLQRERQEAQRRLEQERPNLPQLEAGQTVSPEAQQEWQARQEEWSRRQIQLMGRFNSNRAVSVGFDRTQIGRLISGNELTSGRAINVWPCLILATGYQRNQNLSLRENKPAEKGEAVKGEAAQDQPISRSTSGTEVIEGGQLTDGLSLMLSIFLEPKLQDRAQVRLVMSEARDDAGEELLSMQEPRLLAPASNITSGGIIQRIGLHPRQSKRQKLAVLRGMVRIRYPMKTQQHEITNFNAPQNFTVGNASFLTSVQFDPPRLENGRLRFGASAELSSERGGRALRDSLLASPGSNSLRVRDFLPSEGPLGVNLLPQLSRFTFIDTQGRTWGDGGGGLKSFRFRGLNGQIIPVTSPPQPLPDNFTYLEDVYSYLVPLPPGVSSETATSVRNIGIAGSASAPVLSPEELAQVRFTKATFTTESDWRTIEVPFEFRDLPLPPR